MRKMLLAKERVGWGRATERELVDVAAVFGAAANHIPSLRPDLKKIMPGWKVAFYYVKN
jgi:hypothetical protein